MFFQSIDASPNRPPHPNRSAAGIRRQSRQLHPPLQGIRQSSRRSSFEDRLPTGKRRSLSLTLPQSDARSMGVHSLEPSPYRFHSPREQGSEAGSVASAPTLKYQPRELRDPQSTSARSLQYREESPPNIRNPQLENIRSHSKVVRKLLVGMKKATMSRWSRRNYVFSQSFATHSRRT